MHFHLRYLRHPNEVIEIGAGLFFSYKEPADVLLKEASLEGCGEFRIFRQNNLIFVENLDPRQILRVNKSQGNKLPLKHNDILSLGRDEFLFLASDFISPYEYPVSRKKSWSSELTKLPKIAASQFPVLLIGPTGSGKEELAKMLWRLSPRWQTPFVTVNCSAFNENLIESELFGHKRGAFTGAAENRKGAFEKAKHGTLFLDEVADLSQQAQTKILRAIENNEIKPVGSDEVLKTDVRILAATNKDLLSMVQDGSFRADLYYRLNVFQINPPSLNQRLDDFETITRSLLGQLRVGIERQAIDYLKTLHWKGNIRELKHFLIRASTYTTPGEKIVLTLCEQLAESYGLRKHEDLPPTDRAGFKSLACFEKEIIKRYLIETQGNQSEAAKLLGIARSTMNTKLKTYGINAKTIYRDRFVF